MQHVTFGDGQSLAYRDIHPKGAQDGPPLLFLHGGGLDHRMWEPQTRSFADHRILLPDARGHGASSTPVGPYRLVDDVVAVLDAADVADVVVIGLSMGAGTAVDLAVTHPERVRGLVVSGTGTSDPEFRDPWVLEIFELWQRAVTDVDVEVWVEGFARLVRGRSLTHFRGHRF